MSVSTLLEPATETQTWSSLYSNSLATAAFQLNTPAAALGKVLTSDAKGVASWQLPSIPMNDSVVWRPGAVSSPPYVRLWTEVVVAVNGGAKNVYVDSSLVDPLGAEVTSIGMPVGGWDMSGVTFYALSTSPESRTNIVFDSTATIYNALGFYGLFLITIQPMTALGSFVLGNFGILRFDNGVQVFINDGASFPAITVDGASASPTGGVGFETSIFTNGSLTPFIFLKNAAEFVIFSAINSISPQVWYQLPFIESDNSGNAVLNIFDASSPARTWTLPGDTILDNPIDLSQSVFYDDTLVSPPLGSSTVQGAIDALKGTEFKFPLLAPPDSAAAPSYSFAGDTATGVYHDGKASVGITCGGSEVLSVSQAALTVTPGTPLNLGGALNLTGGQNISGLQTITAETGVNLNVIDGSSNNQLTIPSSGNQVQIINTLQLGSGGITEAGLITTTSSGMILQNPSSSFIFQVGNNPSGDIGFFGAPPIHPGGSYHDTNVVSTGLTPAFTEDAYDGGVGGSTFTIGGLVLALKQLGLIGP